MTISGIGSGNYTMGQMAGMGNRPSPAEMFSKIDEDGSGGLDQAEFSDLAMKIGEMTGEDVDAEALFAQYDEDGDGELSEEETQALMEDNRPEGPPPGGMMGGMGGMQGGSPELSQLFSDADEDEDDSLDENEAQGIAEMISNATGEEMTVDSLIADYDEDGDGTLSEEETRAALEANGPGGPPPPSQPGVAESGNSSWAQISGVDAYMAMANLGMGQDQSSVLSAMFSDSNSSSGALLSVNTMV